MKRLTAGFVVTSILCFSPILYADVAYYGDEDSSYSPASENYSPDNYGREQGYSDADFNREFSEPRQAQPERYQRYEDERYYEQPRRSQRRKQVQEDRESYASMPGKIAAPGERVVVVDPRIHGWGAYSETGKLLRSGVATAGASYCRDIGKPCRTKTGVFRIYSLGDADCYSRKFPIGEGGAPMPYCMYFNGGQGIHGSDGVAYANLSHGCVRVRVSDARWLRYNFVKMHTKVIVKPY